MKKREPSCTNNHDAQRRYLRDNDIPHRECPNCGWLLSAAREEPLTLEERLSALEERVAELEGR